LRLVERFVELVRRSGRVDEHLQLVELDPEHDLLERQRRRRRLRVLRMRRGLAAALSAGVVLAGCNGGGEDTGAADGAAALQSYVQRVEPIRLGINRLLDRADPILSAYADNRLTPGQAQRRVDALERRVADYAVRIAEVRPVPPSLRAVHRAYAHTFIFEDSYMSALAAAVPEREFDDLPDTQAQQRAAIIAWRTQLQVLADRWGVSLPGDLQVAGRGEIAPSPLGE
jgi:hypothetical protein